MIDLKQLQYSLSDERIIELVKSLGTNEYKETQDAIIFKTICHNETDEHASFKLYYYKDTHCFHCYTECGCNFNIYELFKKRYELTHTPYNFYKDIVLKISDGRETIDFNDFYEPYQSDLEKYKERKTDVKINIISQNLLNTFSEYYTPEWLYDGISIQSMKQFNILYSINQNKIIIPHYNIDNLLVGIRGRALNDEDIAIGKYMPVEIEGIIYSHPLGYNLYGLNLNKNNIRNKKIAIVFESEKSVLLYETFFGRENNVAVAVCGSNFSNYQFQLLKKCGAEKIIIAFDKEGDNWNDKEKYLKKLNILCKRHCTECVMGYIYDYQNLLRLKDSPIDRGKDIFLQLYKGVKWIK